MSDKERLSLHADGGSSKKNASRSKGMSPWLPVVLVLLLAGGAAWFWLGSEPAERDALVDATRETLAEVKDKAGQVMSGESTGNTAEERISMGTPSESSTEGGFSDADGATDPMTPTDAPADLNGDESGMTANGEDSSEGSGERGGTDGMPEGHQDLGAGSTGGTVSGPEAPVTRGLLATDTDNAVPSDLARRDDAVVRVAFIDDLAEWLVAGYSPATSRGGRGMISVGIQSANARYGVGMQGLAWIGDDLPAGRAEALAYVYTPSMLDALYRMYVDRFMEAMGTASEAPRKDGKVLEPEQIAEMYRLYARRFRSLSGTMQGIAATSDLRERAARIHTASQNMMEANSRYMEAVFAFDQARASGGNEKAVDTARTAMEAASDAYQQATYERDQLREELIGIIRNNPEARSLGDDNVLYVALWVDRRLQKSPQALDATMQAATLFLDVAQRFENVAGVRP